MTQQALSAADRASIFNAGTLKVLSTHGVENLKNCLGCDNCAGACNWSLVGDTNPFERAEAIRDALKATSPKSMARGGEEAAERALDGLAEKVFASCTMCGRCAVVCPYGVNPRELTYAARAGLLKAGLAPKWARKISENSRKLAHSLGRTVQEVWDDLIARAGKLDEIPDIPIHVPGKDWLIVCSAIANTRIPDTVINVFVLLLKMKTSFTTVWDLIDTGTEVNTAVHDPDVSDKYVSDLIAAAKRLGCKGLVLGECGCDVRFYSVEAAERIREAGLVVITVDQLMLETIKEGRLRLTKQPTMFTFHDPCWYGRLTGQYETPREILRECAEEVVELTPNREMAYCCNGGAGMMHAYPGSDPVDLRNRRRAASAPKAEQLRQAVEKGATVVVTPCASFYLSLADTVRHYRIPIKVMTLNDLIKECLATGGEA